VSGVAHELNNPLAGIAAFAQLLLSEPRLARDERTAAEMIYAESRRAARIVQSLLGFARQHKPERTATAINQVLDDTLELRSYDLRVRGIAVAREYDPALPETLADAHQLQQVFLNLVTNAEQAMEQDTTDPRLTVRTRRSGDSIRIEVEDRGRGIAQNLVDRIFQPFFTTKPAGAGTGLGLSISLGFVREHGGRLWAENAAGGGARFTVELPIISPPSKTPVGTPVEPAVGDQLHILVVDDEASVRLALARYFTGRGHHAETSASAREALARLHTAAFDAVIVDLRMPEVSGEEMYAALCAQDATHAARVIFTTGQLMDDHVRAFLAATARPVIAKPFEFSTLERVLAGVRAAT
jgi:two-component system NtrC family sensor kinase